MDEDDLAGLQVEVVVEPVVVGLEGEHELPGVDAEGPWAFCVRGLMRYHRVRSSVPVASAMAISRGRR